MTNWSSFSSGAGARVTTWNYNTNRGWLDSKRYDNNQGPDYTYTAAGRLRSRTWARIGTSSTRISTTYTYGFNDSTSNNEHGDLLTVTYANDPQATPSLTNTYDRRGRVGTVARNGITTSFAYNFAGQTLSETNTGGTLNSWWVANGYDPLLRRTNLAVKAGSTLNASYTYGYDTASRLASVSDGTNNANYLYVANSPLVGQITLKSNAATRLTVNKAYDYLNRLQSITSTPSGAPGLSFAYGLNAANQRVQVTLADGSFWVYQYDSLGQVQSAKRYWPGWTPVAGQQFEYAHDDIGNRTSTKAGGDENGWNLRSATYAANNLNQYTNRTVPGAVDIMGVANVGATVTVNNQATYRHGEYYRKELAIGNGSAPQWQGVTNKAVQGTSSNTVIGSVFLAKTPEVFSYDADGNLTNDGHYGYTWDAENRVVFMQTVSALPNAAQYQLQMEYDWQGRRIRKTVSTYNGHKWAVATDTKFVWDGWNCVVEPNPSDAVQRRYMWGLDLSSSLQGAGGVGGLLAVQDVAGATGTHFAAFDGNGNVVALVKASDGTMSANYEYGAFGEVLRSSGAMAKVNPVRFSTKYQDDESDLLCYGYRYYGAITARWLSRDPLDENGALDLYAFVVNNPLKWADRNGSDGVTVITVPRRKPSDRPDNGAESQMAHGATAKAVKNGWTVLFVTDINDANGQLKKLGCCIKELNIEGHGAGSGQWVGHLQGDDSKWIGLRPDGNGGYTTNGFQMFAGVKFCPTCTIWVRGCQTTRGDAGNMFIQTLAAATGCTVKGFCVNSSVGPNGLSGPGLGWWNDLWVTDSAAPPRQSPSNASLQPSLSD